ncbi:HutD-family protein [Ochrobactrum sp. MYb15]|uniref:HutD/Ves family protein n=1 Tax=Brucella TaxID=234 RepID=UPI000464530E|nr:HutD family protein [Brucella rhizosphaerae]PQZ51340.1 HutD-family protein [Ochrobactrum sp. MYb19]PRA56008.1 HutD-family protein [Ochrobactrum sp. MYb68]PRA65626.1 HutD-family protein [Ochrobactrum sp. MYb18]PRA77316.1 HutD-family protein [Brucella thiophenivorans]PRA93049.1 HutD-family protein [Ochrobactrum sp. MYb14]PRA99326.1 HutD-family protein [Ochrobactrum sp. MYb15]
MEFKVLKAQDHRRMPWKNGGGVTVEIAIHPINASVDNFDWRISTATVANDGPFSVFPDIDRTLSVLEGIGIVLDVEGLETTLSRETAPFAFAADASSGARLIDGTITDLNVMTRRGRFTHQVERIVTNDSAIIAPDRGTMLVFCAEGNFELKSDSRIAHLGQHDCLILSGEAQFSVELIGKGIVYKISIIQL